MMKKSVFALLVLCLLACCLSASAKPEPALYGTWLDFAHTSKWGESERTLTRADFFASNGSLSDGYTFHEDGTVDICVNGEILDTGSWEETDESALFAQEGLEGAYTVLVQDSSGTKVLCAFMNSIMYTTSYSSVSSAVQIYIKPEILAIEPRTLHGRTWVLSHVFLEDYDENRLGGKYDYVEPADLKHDLRFSLRPPLPGQAGNPVDLLIDYIPQHAKWDVSGMNIYLQLEDGAELELQLQYDDSLFGTYKASPDAEPFYLEFDRIESFWFKATPDSLDSLEGKWHLSGAHDSLMSHYTLDQLTFTQALTIGDGYAVLAQKGSKSDWSVQMSASVVGGPILTEQDTGTILLLTNPQGKILPFWLLKDGSLYQRNPGSSCMYYAKEAENH